MPTVLISWLYLGMLPSNGSQSQCKVQLRGCAFCTALLVDQADHASKAIRVTSCIQTLDFCMGQHTTGIPECLLL